MKQPQIQRRLKTETQLCEWLGITKACARAWRRRGVGPKWIKVGRLIRYDEDAIAQWLNEQTVDAGSNRNG